MKRARAGFTLIEALAVVSIIGVLASLTIYIYNSGLARSRDARRKSDLVAIGLGFQARYDSQICSNPTDIGFYPGRRFIPTKWKPVAALASLNDDCGAFSEFLAVIPTDPNNDKGTPYRFDLAALDNGQPVAGKHYRLTAHLEKNLSLQEQTDLARMISIWTGTFGGAALPPSLSGNYNYVVGK